MINKNTIRNSRKGVTPVIAIVLLLTVTIGAVGILYTQVGDLLDQGSDTEDMNRVQDTDIDIRTGINGSNGNLRLSIQNTGERALPFSDDFGFQINGVDYEAYGAAGSLSFSQTNLTDSQGCLGSNMNLDIEETTGEISSLNDDTCSTGVEFPTAFDDPVTVTFTLEGSSKTWDYTCEPKSGDDGFC